jgi:hypothetical protein
LWLAKRQDVISVFLKWILCILEEVPCTDGMLCKIFARSIRFVVEFNWDVSFCFCVWMICPLIRVRLKISHYHYIGAYLSFWSKGLLKLSASTLGAYRFTIIFTSSWIDSYYYIVAIFVSSFNFCLSQIQV